MKKIQWKSHITDAINDQHGSPHYGFESSYADEDVEKKLAELKADQDLYDVRVVEDD